MDDLIKYLTDKYVSRSLSLLFSVDDTYVSVYDGSPLVLPYVLDQPTIDLHNELYADARQFGPCVALCVVRKYQDYPFPRISSRIRVVVIPGDEPDVYQINGFVQG